MAEATAIDLKRFLSSMRLGEQKSAPQPMIAENLGKVTEDVSDADRFLSGLAALVFNVPAEGKFEKAKIGDIVGRIDKLVSMQLNEVIHAPKFQELESTWRGIEDLVTHTNFKANIAVDLLDVSKAE